MSFIHLAPEVVIRFQIGSAPSQQATLVKGASIKAFKIDGLNIRHFFNVYRKKHGCTLYLEADEDILSYCFVPDGFRKGDTLNTVLASVEPEHIQYIGKEPRVPQFLLLLQKVTAAAPNRAEQAVAVMELMRMMQSEDGRGLMAEYPRLKATVIAKCKELRLMHYAEFPAVAAECARVLWMLGEEVILYEPIAAHSLAPEVAIRFQIGSAPSQLTTLISASCISAFRIDGLNIRHFFNLYCKKHGCTLFIKADEDILQHCFVPTGFCEGDSLAIALSTVEPSLQRLIGKDPRIPKIERLLARIPIMSREERVPLVMELLRGLQNEDLSLVLDNPGFMGVVIAKCEELWIEHHKEFPELGHACRSVLLKLGKPFLLPSEPEPDDVVLKNWRLLPSSKGRAPILLTLKVGDYGGQNCLLFSDQREIYSTYYGKQVHMCRHFNRYMKACGAPKVYRPFVEILKFYFVDDKNTTSLYDYLLNWHEEAKPVEHFTVQQFNEQEELDCICDCNACLRREIQELRATLAKLQNA